MDFNRFLDYLNITLYANTIQKWLIAIGIFLGSFIALLVIKRIIGRRFSKLAQVTRLGFDDFLVDLIDRTQPLFLIVVGLYLGSLALVITQPVRELLNTLLIIAILLQVALWGNGLIAYLIDRKVRQQIEKDAESATTLDAMGLIAKIVLWSVIALLVLENITGIQVDSLIASLGIGGIAVALAVQNILGDLFSSLSIALDKPFVIGDFIIIGEFLGTVEHIGLKSTRVRSLSGEQLVFSNSDLLSSRIRNYKRMARRRIVFTLGVTYQTSHDKVAAIPTIIREIIESHETASFDRSHFSSYGDFSLNFESVYYVEVPDYNTYMDIQQSINLSIYKRFQEEGIEFAYPTQTLFLEKETA